MISIKKFYYKHKKSIIQMLKYCVTGGASFLADYLAFTSLEAYIHYQIANYIGLFIGLGVNYLMSKLWVFDNQNQINTKEVASFVVVTAIGFGLSGLSMYIGVDLLHFDSKLIKIATAIIVFIFNFIARKFFIWKEV